jgi:hypothetical protein
MVGEGRQSWGPPKDEFSGVLSSREIDGAASEIKANFEP